MVTRVNVRFENEATSKDQSRGNIFTCSFLVLAFIIASVTANLASIHRFVAVQMGNDAKQIEAFASDLVQKGYAKDEKVAYQVGLDGSGPLYVTVSVPERIKQLAKKLSFPLDRMYEVYGNGVFEKGILYLTALASIFCTILAFWGRPHWLGLLGLPTAAYALWIVFLR